MKKFLLTVWAWLSTVEHGTKKRIPNAPESGRKKSVGEGSETGSSNQSPEKPVNRWTATSFADQLDLVRYNKRVWDTGSPRAGLEVGDNGYGAWGLSTVEGTGPAVALPRFDIEKACGSTDRQPRRLVRVFYGEKWVDCQVRDIAPNGIIDLNPDAVRALGLQIPLKMFLDWIWL